MKKYILFFAILLTTQAHGQYGGWNYFFLRAGNTISQSNTLDTLKLNNLKMPAGTAGHILTINSAGNVTTQAAGAASIDLTANYNWTGTHTFDDFIKKADMLEYLGDAMKATAAAGVTDTTAFYMPIKLFSTSDSATIDFCASNRFASLDSIVLLGGTISTLGDSAAFSVAVRQTTLGGAYAGAFNAAAIDSSDLGTANTQKRWKLSSFGSLTASTRSTLRVKIWRSACTNNTGSDVYIERVLIYGVGLR